jgi:hypothetical protein
MPRRLRRDVELAISFDFNGRAEAPETGRPRWLYWCDVLGLLVWCEMPSAYRFTSVAVERLVAEWILAIRRDYSHPCIAAWVPLNESWGVPDLPTNPAHREYVRALYSLTKTLDPTRPVVGKRRVEHIATDIVTIHDYASSARVIRERLRLAGGGPGRAGATASREGVRSRSWGSPWTSIRSCSPNSAGSRSSPRAKRAGDYNRVADSEALLSAFTRLVGAVHESGGLAGFCFTQLTDTFQEKIWTRHRAARAQGSPRANRRSDTRPPAGAGDGTWTLSRMQET